VTEDGYQRRGSLAFSYYAENRSHSCNQHDMHAMYSMLRVICDGSQQVTDITLVTCVRY